MPITTIHEHKSESNTLQPRSRVKAGGKKRTLNYRNLSEIWKSGISGLFDRICVIRFKKQNNSTKSAICWQLRYQCFKFRIIFWKGCAQREPIAGTHAFTLAVQFLTHSFQSYFFLNAFAASFSRPYTRIQRDRQGQILK